MVESLVNSPDTSETPQPVLKLHRQFSLARLRESIVEWGMFLCSSLSILVTAAILFVLLIETVILVIALLIAGQNALVWLPVLLPLYAFWALFTTGIALALAAANVFFHDVQYLWSIVTQVLFYATPVIYFSSIISLAPLRRLAIYGPTGAFVEAFHSVLYDGRMPELTVWAYLTALAVLSFAGGAWFFSRLSPKFAEEM